MHDDGSSREAKAEPLGSLWRNRDYMVLWAGQSVSNAGTVVSGIAFPLLILTMTGSAAQAGIVSALEKLPFPILSLVAGALIDRWDRKKVMIICDTGRALALGSIATALWIGRFTMAQVYVVALVEGTLFVFFNLAETAGLPQVVPTEQLPTAMAQNQVSFSLAALVGPPLGGILFQVRRALPFLGDALSYAVSAVSLFFIQTRFQAQRHPEAAPLQAEILEGLRWLWRHRLIRSLALLSGGFNLFFGGTGLIIIVLAKQDLAASPDAIGLLFGFAAAAGILGSVLAAKVRGRFTVGQATIGWWWALVILWLLVGLAPNIIVLGVILAAFYLILPAYDVVQYSYRLSLIPDELQGRVNSVFRLVSFGGQPVGLALSGALLQSFGARPAVGAVLAGLVVLALFTTINPHVRNAGSSDGDARVVEAL